MSETPPSPELPISSAASRNGHAVLLPGGTPASPPRRAAPPPNPFDVSRPYAVIMSLALMLALLPGLGTGLLLVFVAGLRLPMAIGWPQLAQAHGQIQALGFVLLFIVAVGLQLFPRFLGSPTRHAGWAVWGACGITVALLCRWVGQPLAADDLRAVLLTLAAVGVPLGAAAAALAFHGLGRGRALSAAGPGAWRRFVAVGGVALASALVLYVSSSLQLARGALIVPQPLDEALIHLELFGFATCLVLGVASRVFGRFLLLRTRPALEGLLPMLAAAWCIGLVLVAAGWLIDASWAIWARLAGALVELTVLGVWLWMIGLYASPSRASGTPYVTGPTRRWVRMAFFFLAFGLALDLALFAREAFVGVPASSAELSAARHSLAQGFLLPLMVAMATRLLPILSADVLKHRLRLELTVDLLLLGALVRVIAEATGGYAAWSGAAISLGATIGVIGFTIFAIDVWSSLLRLPAFRQAHAQPRGTSPAK